MPDVNGVLTQEERAKVDIWFKKNWVNKKCPICGSLQFTLADHMIMPMIYSQYLSINGVQYPQIMIICQRCGITLHFDAIAVGIDGGITSHGQE